MKETGNEAKFLFFIFSFIMNVLFFSSAGVIGSTILLQNINNWHVMQQITENILLRSSRYKYGLSWLKINFVIFKWINCYYFICFHNTSQWVIILIFLDGRRINAGILELDIIFVYECKVFSFAKMFFCAWAEVTLHIVDFY